MRTAPADLLALSTVNTLPARPWTVGTLSAALPAEMERGSHLQN